MTRANLFKASSLLALDGFLQRLAGLLSTLILARILLPEDFGLVTMALMVIWFSTTITATGSELYLQSRKVLDEEDINSAFTLNILLKLSVFIVLALCSQFVAQWLETPELTEVIIALTVVNAISCFNNPAVVYLRRENKYKKIVIVGITAKLMRIAVTVTTAIIWKNHWALVAGHATGTLVQFFGGYVIYHYLPKFDTSRISKQFRFSSWILLQSILGFSRDQIDVALTGVVMGKAELGAYNNIKFISNMPISSFLQPLTSPIINNIRELIGFTDEVRLRVNVTFLFLSILISPAVIFLTACHHDVVLIVLGPNWTEYSFLLAAFSSLYFFRAFSLVLNQVIILKDEVKKLFTFDFVMTMSFLLVVFFNSERNFEMFVWSLILLEFVSRLLFILYVYNSYFDSLSSFMKINVVPIVFTFLVSFFVELPLFDSNVYLNLLYTGIIVLFSSTIFMLMFCLIMRDQKEVGYLWHTLKPILVKSYDKFFKRH
ncbi:oligosaccharide flippase family protein [Aestuariibacter sp. GS-14]|uniref:oligosaccharide flippase family protein n=1 Tax=Aestuariibacter sp. GS-14 TaxID=2590670 RepID=UPI0015E86683|nr:oligosaccharide flippase family protein [Aestuariibacter sp. GS-14]